MIMRSTRASGRLAPKFVAPTCMTEALENVEVPWQLRQLPPTPWGSLSARKMFNPAWALALSALVLRVQLWLPRGRELGVEGFLADVGEAASGEGHLDRAAGGSDGVGGEAGKGNTHALLRRCAGGTGQPDARLQVRVAERIL